MRVIGKLQTFQGQRSITAFTIIPIEDRNEMTFHFLEVICAHETNKRLMTGNANIINAMAEEPKMDGNNNIINNRSMIYQNINNNNNNNNNRVGNQTHLNFMRSPQNVRNNPQIMIQRQQTTHVMALNNNNNSNINNNYNHHQNQSQIINNNNNNNPMLLHNNVNNDTIMQSSNDNNYTNVQRMVLEVNISVFLFYFLFLCEGLILLKSHKPKFY